MEWYGEEYLASVEALIGERVEQAGEYVGERVRENIGVQGTRKTPSKPGEFPKRQTGGVQASVEEIYHGEELTSYIGSSSPVAGFLTRGTVKMEPREFLLRTVSEEAPVVIEMITSGAQPK